MQIQRLDDGDFLIHIDCDLRSVAERKMFIAKDEDGNLVNPENVPIIVRLARARKMIEMLSSGTYRNKQEIGDMFGMSQAQVSRLCRSVFLSRGPLRAATPCLRHLPFELRSSAHRDRRETRRRHIAAPALHGGRRQAHHASPLGRATRAPGDRLKGLCKTAVCDICPP